ncbi:hypothetical protein HaLaN_23657, partial [Haematococcus lacustris]
MPYDQGCNRALVYFHTTATARHTAHSVMAKKMRKGSDKKHKVSRSAQGKQRQERRDGWTTRRRQLTAPPYVSPHCRQGPRGRSVARLQEDQAQAPGAPPAAG